ncbi:MAG TPA: glycosyltransferase [Solirubrobacteraceae bacterium]|jgi:hypothetical protein
MRLVVVKHGYPHYLQTFYRRWPELRDGSYEEQRAAFDHDSFWWGGAWGRALPAEGIEVTELLHNAEPLQRAWARERGLSINETAWREDILRRQIKEAAPDALFLQSFKAMTPRLLAIVRAENPGLRAVIAWVGGANQRESLLKRSDHVLTCVPELVDQFRAAGLRCSLMHHAFDPTVRDRMRHRYARPAIPLSFAGNVLDRAQHGSRSRLIRRLAATTGIEVYANVPEWRSTRRGALARRASYMTVTALRKARVSDPRIEGVSFLRAAARMRHPPRLPPPPVPADRLRPPVYGLRMFETLARSTVTLNVHSEIFPHSIANLRTFEAGGAGTCQLIERRRNLPELFEPDHEVVAYESPEDCVERARWLLEHPAEAARIGAAGLRRTLSQHTFAHRAPILADAIRAALA